MVRTLIAFVLALAAPAAAPAATLGPVTPLSDPHTDFDAAYSSDVAYNPRADEYLVAWVEGRVVHVRRVGRDGQGLGPAARISDTSSPLSARDPRVVYDSTRDRYLVVWSAERSSSEGWFDTLHGQRLDSSGMEVGDDFTISPETRGFAGRPEVVYNPRRDEFFILWTHTEDVVIGPSRSRAVARRIAADGPEPHASELEVIKPSTRRAAALALAYDRSRDRYLVTFTHERPGRPRVRALLLTARGARTGPASGRIDSGGSPVGAVNAYDSRLRSFLVAWYDGERLHTRRLDGRARPIGSVRAASSWRENDGGRAQGLGYDARERQFVVLWSEVAFYGSHNSETALYTRRLSPSGAARGSTDVRVSIPHEGGFDDPGSIARGAALAAGPGHRLFVWHDWSAPGNPGRIRLFGRSLTLDARR